MRWTKKLAVLGVGAALVTAVGCSSGEKAETSTKQVGPGEKVQVQTVLQAQADFVREVGKDHVEVATFIPLGTNVWQYAPTMKEIRDAEKSDMLVLNGGNLENRWYDQLYATVKLKNKDLLVVNPAEGLEEMKLLRYNNPDDPEAQKKEHVDPYFYLDPQNAKHEVDKIAEGLSKKAPDYADEFKKNADDYKKKLDELDQKYKDTLSKAKRQEIVSPFPAFQYLAKRYGLKYYVPMELSYNDFPFDQPDKQQALAEELKKHDVSSLYFEQEAAPRVQEFLGGIGYKSRILNPYEGRLEETGYKSYIQVMEDNLKALEEGLNE